MFASMVRPYRRHGSQDSSGTANRHPMAAVSIIVSAVTRRGLSRYTTAGCTRCRLRSAGNQQECLVEDEPALERLTAEQLP
jgi:hypothetical protein